MAVTVVKYPNFICHLFLQDFATVPRFNIKYGLVQYLGWVVSPFFNKKKFNETCLEV